MDLKGLFNLAKKHDNFKDFEKEIKRQLTNTPSTAIPPDVEVIIGKREGDYYTLPYTQPIKEIIIENNDFEIEIHKPK